VRFEKTARGSDQIGQLPNTGGGCTDLGSRVKCLMHGSLKVGVDGALTIPVGQRCRTAIWVIVGRVAPEKPRLERGSGRTVFDRKPFGCPGAPPRSVSLKEIVRFHLDYGLDLDLGGDIQLIASKARKDLVAWSTGGKVQNRAYAQWFVPLGRSDLRELKYRNRYMSLTARVIEAWVSTHARDSYVGLYIDHSRGGLLVVGFVGDQETEIAELRTQKGILAPGRVVGFSRPPRFTLVELEGVQSAILRGSLDDAPYARTINSWGIDVERNVVVVESLRVKKTRRLLAKRFGEGAPIIVRFGASPVPVTGRSGPRGD
jgi:hypothetical protein